MDSAGSPKRTWWSTLTNICKNTSCKNTYGGRGHLLQIRIILEGVYSNTRQVVAAQIKCPADTGHEVSQSCTERIQRWRRVTIVICRHSRHACTCNHWHYTQNYHSGVCVSVHRREDHCPARQETWVHGWVMGVWYFFYVMRRQPEMDKKRGICMDSAGSPQRTW